MKRKNISILIVALLLAACNMPGEVDVEIEPEPTQELITEIPATEAPKGIEDTPEEEVILPQATETLPPLEAEPTNTPVEIQEPTAPILPTPTISDDPIQSLDDGISLVISDITMIDSTIGWAVGGVEDGDNHILKTIDGALTFRDVSPPVGEDYENYQVKAFFLDSSHAWAIYTPGGWEIPDQAIIWRTTDGGEIWLPSEPLTFPMAEFFEADDLLFADNQFGWFLVHVGAGMSKDYIYIFSTKNGGKSWDIVFDPYSPYGPHSCGKTGYDFLADGRGVLTLDCWGVRDGAIINTTANNGVQWIEHLLPAPESFAWDFNSDNVCHTHSPQILENGQIFAAVSCKQWVETKYESSGNFQFSLEVGSEIWESHEYPGGSLLYVNENIAYAFSDEIYISYDGGLTWEKQKDVTWEAEASFVGVDIGWAVVRSDGEVALVYSDNRGLQWEIIEPVLVP